jgi:hypothetical protein
MTAAVSAPPGTYWPPCVIRPSDEMAHAEPSAAVIVPAPGMI